MVPVRDNPSRPKTFGWNAVRLSEHSFADLSTLRDMVINDPKSVNPRHASGDDINLYTPAARMKLDALSWAVFYKKQDSAKAEGRA